MRNNRCKIFGAVVTQKRRHSAIFTFLAIPFTIIASIFLQSCTATSSNPYEIKCNGGIVRIDRMHDSLNFLRFIKNDSVVSEVCFPYPVYQLDYGDLNGDGKDEIAIGVIKSTRYFKNKGKRLFIYQINSHDHIRPLWLGSRAGSELINFHIERDSVPARVITQNQYIEQIFPDSINEQNFKGIRFKLGAFGLEFENYVK